MKRVHAFRIPLSPAGQRIAQVVYFSIPVLGGYFIMDWATSKAREEIEFDDRGGKEEEKEDDRRRVLGNMGIPQQAERVAEHGVRAQNETMKSYLEALRRQGGQRP